MYGYSSAFTLFISAGGLAVFIDRIKVRLLTAQKVLPELTDLPLQSEIELCIAAHSASDSTATSEAPTGLLSFEQAALLKGLLRAIQRLMQTAGTTEGLRNLIDSSLLSSVKLVMENRQVFGPQIFALCKQKRGRAFSHLSAHSSLPQPSTSLRHSSTTSRLA